MSVASIYDELQIAIIGTQAEKSGWAILLIEDGIPFRTFKTQNEIDICPDFLICLKDASLNTDKWKDIPTIFDYQIPNGVILEAEIWSECIYDDSHTEINVDSFICPFRGFAIRWDGPSLGYFLLARDSESPKYPIACFTENSTFLLGDFSKSITCIGYSFRPICMINDEQFNLLHPASNRGKAINFLRKILWESLRIANLPTIRLSPFPPTLKPPFIFRLDVDYLLNPKLLPIRKVASCLNLKITSFINISGEEKWEDNNKRSQKNLKSSINDLKWIGELVEEGHEIASHGYFHRLWPQYQDTLSDLVKAKEILEGIIRTEVKGHASPGGLWHPEAGRASRDAGFKYTSEASLAWNGNPFFPIIGESKHYPMQIPCSPIYPVYNLANENQIDNFFKHFELLAKEASNNKEILSFMGHPHDLEEKSLTFWERLYEVIKLQEFNSVTFSEVYNYFRMRNQVKLRILKIKGNYYSKTSEMWEVLINDKWILSNPNDYLKLDN